MEQVTEQIQATGPVCINCGTQLSDGSRFCQECGTMQQAAKVSVAEHAFEPTAKILAVFYLVDLVTCLTVGHVDYFRDYRHMVWAELFLAVWALLFAGITIRRMLPLYSFTNVKLTLLALCAVGAVVFSLVVNVTSDWINLQVFDKQVNYYPTYMGLQHSTFFFFMSLALYPAIFEEMAFRGVIYNYVEDVAGGFNAVVISAAAFAIIHVSVISLVWIVPFGLLAGYLRRRYHTLWYGMVLHFFFNATVCVSELYAFGVW